MTIPYERARAIRQTEEFLKELLSVQKTPRVPKKIRDQARHLLRHYPGLHDLKMIEAEWKSDFIECPVATKDSLFGELK
jgi:hypothetical protein